MKSQRHSAIRDILARPSISQDGAHGDRPAGGNHAISSNRSGAGSGHTGGANSSNGAVSSQEALRRKLAARGIHVTQATLSRDIHELRLVKGPDGYALPGDFDEDEDDLPEIAGVVADFGLEVRQAQNLLVLLTTVGGAQPVAASLDYEEFDEVVGTIAGDNTVLIVCPDVRSAAALKSRIEAFLV